MDNLIPTLSELYKQGRMTWTEQGKGWIGRPEVVLGPLATDGFYECHRVRRAPEAPMVFIEIDGESITRPAPTPVGR